MSYTREELDLIEQAKQDPIVFRMAVWVFDALLCGYVCEPPMVWSDGLPQGWFVQNANDEYEARGGSRSRWPYATVAGAVLGLVDKWTAAAAAAEALPVAEPTVPAALAR
jgi:hypothetical protein